MQRHLISRSVSAAIVLVSGASCSNDDSLDAAEQVELATSESAPSETTTTVAATTTSAKATTTTAPAGELTESARTYLEAVANGDDGRPTAEAGSLAWAYADYLQAVNAAFGRSGAPVSGEFDAEGAVFAYEDGSTVRYDNLVVSPGGMVSFDVNGVPLADVLLFSDATQGDGLVVVEQATSYRTASGGFIVTARIRNGGDSNLDVAAYDAAWVSEDGGAQLEPVEWGGSDSIRPGAVGTVTMYYGQVALATSAGTVYFESFLNDFSETASYSAVLME
ncbi:MAG: hypothetical protein ACRBI6_23325 [Acidimicrobiales bacterium]